MICDLLCNYLFVVEERDEQFFVCAVFFGIAETDK